MGPRHAARRRRAADRETRVMKSHGNDDDHALRNALTGLRHGDFSRLEPLFTVESGDAGSRPRILEWLDQGRFDAHPAELAEALTCACFLGCVTVAGRLLLKDVDPASGKRTGMDALHWAANRGQLEAVRLLLKHKAPLETRSRFGGTVLGTAVWSALNEPKPNHALILEEVLKAGAKTDDVEYPSGNAQVDQILERFGAR